MKLTEVWTSGRGEKPKIQTWVMLSDCLVFQNKFDEVQEQLEDLCGMDDLLTGVLSKSKGQILRVSAVLSPTYQCITFLPYFQLCLKFWGWEIAVRPSLYLYASPFCVYVVLDILQTHSFGFLCTDYWYIWDPPDTRTLPCFYALTVCIYGICTD